MKKIFLLAIVLSLTTMVYGQKKLDQKTIDEFGTKTFDKSIEDLFPIIKMVLTNNEYIIELENLEKGKIKTKKKALGETGISTGNGTAQFNRNYRQYIVQLESITPTQTKVVFTPKVWIGEADVSEKKVWVLKGPGGEIKLWENMFTAIEERF